MNPCYALVFVLSAVIFALIGLKSPFWGLTLLSWWCFVSALVMVIAYFFQQPVLVMGKSKNRSFSVVMLVLNFPFLGAYWLLWILRHGFSRNGPVHRIDHTNISVSQWPIFGVPLDQYDVVFDMTSEMPAIYRFHGRYVSLPNMDGVPLCRWEIPPDINRDQRILVHCAQGRGRSAVYAAMLLKKLGYASSDDQAYELLKRSRPAVHLTKAQQQQLHRYFKSIKTGKQ